MEERMRPHQIAKRRRTFDTQLSEYLETLEAGAYPADEFINGFLNHFVRIVNAETVAEVRDHLEARGLIENDEVTI